MKKIYFVIGVNGVGKTSVMEPLRKMLDDSFDIHDFDERGVPDNVDRQWRIDETKHWLKYADENRQKNLTTIICGFARPSEIENKGEAGFILLDADEKIIEGRLRKRYQMPRSVEGIERVSGKNLEQFIADNVNFSSILRKEAQESGVEIINTNELSPEEVAAEVLKRIN